MGGGGRAPSTCAASRGCYTTTHEHTLMQQAWEAMAVTAATGTHRMHTYFARVHTHTHMHIHAGTCPVQGFHAPTCLHTLTQHTKANARFSSHASTCSPDTWVHTHACVNTHMHIHLKLHIHKLVYMYTHMRDPHTYTTHMNTHSHTYT